jgi:hypothetical protein
MHIQMESLEILDYLAAANTTYSYPKRRENIDPSIPFFEIRRDELGRHHITGYNYEHHDNAPRMALWEQYMRGKILPHIKTDISGWYNIELHDSYTYLDNGKDYANCLVFSRFKHERPSTQPVLIPDPYAMSNWGGRFGHLQVNDHLLWKDKKDKVCFFGTTTGKRDPALNERIKLCLWAVDKPFCDMKITKVAQMAQSDFMSACRGNDITCDPVPISKHIEYKYHLMMDGNTCRFDIWNFKTNSVTLKYESPEMLWYYPMMRAGEHFVNVTRDTLESKMHMDPAAAMRMTQSAQTLFDFISQPYAHVYYLSKIFENMSYNKI